VASESHAHLTNLSAKAIQKRRDTVKKIWRERQQQILRPPNLQLQRQSCTYIVDESVFSKAEKTRWFSKRAGLFMAL
jgi:hypothetical protein